MEVGNYEYPKTFTQCINYNKNRVRNCTFIEWHVSVCICLASLPS